MAETKAWEEIMALLFSYWTPAAIGYWGEKFSSFAKLQLNEKGRMFMFSIKKMLFWDSLLSGFCEMFVKHLSVAMLAVVPLKPLRIRSSSFLAIDIQVRFSLSSAIGQTPLTV